VDEYGDEAGNTDVGSFKIKIRETQNHVVVSNDAVLFINPFNDYMKKIRIYADCVRYHGPKNYTVTFRYENDNGDPIYIPAGVNNKLTGPGATDSSGVLPDLFMPGAATFEIQFNGKKMVWNLTSFGSTNKSSVSSSSTSESGECEAKLDGAYSVYPNPVVNELNIRQYIAETSEVTILNMYGVVVSNGGSFDGSNAIITIPMSGFTSGLYIVRIVSATQVRTINIIKE